MNVKKGKTRVVNNKPVTRPTKTKNHVKKRVVKVPGGKLVV